MAEIIRFATRLGSLRPNSLSLRCLRQPETTSAPASSRASSLPMSAGSFCRSPSIGTITSPRGAPMPAAHAAGRLDAGAHRRGLPEVEAEADPPQLRPRGRHPGERSEGAVPRSVVDADDLVRPAELRQLAEELVQQRLDVLLFVEQRNDDGNLRVLHGRWITRWTPSHNPTGVYPARLPVNDSGCRESCAAGAPRYGASPGRPTAHPRCWSRRAAGPGRGW